MANVQKEFVGKLSITEQFRAIMKDATGQDSVYIHAKETVKALVMNSSLTEREKADIISKTIAGIAGSITSKAMDVAYNMAVNDREAPYALTKVRVDTEMVDANRRNADKEDKLIDSKIAQVDSDIDYRTQQGWELQCKLLRDYGLPINALNINNVLLNTDVSAFIDYSTKGAPIKTGEADYYSKMAQSLMQNGDTKFSFADTTFGALSATGNTLATQGMAYRQTRVAERNFDAFDDNMRQHAANSASSMLGVMIGSTAFTNALAYKDELDLWTESMNYLNGNQ